MEGYRFVTDQYLVPGIGARRLDQLTAADVQRLYNDLAARQLGSATIRLAHAVLRSALAQAVKERLIGANPADVARPPRLERREMRVLTPAQVAAFVTASKANGWHALWLLLVTTGLRPGEALGLRWEDVDLKAGILRVQRVLVPGHTGAWAFEEPTTSKSRRAVPFPANAAAALAEHRRSQLAQRLAAGAAYNDYGLVFANPSGMPADYRTLVVSHFKKILKAVGLPAIRLYDLRHTSATYLLAAGVHPKIVAERLGQ